MMRRWLLPVLAILLLFCPPLLRAQERILDFHSEIGILPDATLEVEETIRVRAEGQLIRRGIYREFPTRYTSPLGVNYRMGFELIDAYRDGQPEETRVESRGNGLRIYLGRPEHFLPPGEYVYRIRYRTTRQIGFFDRHDELYWNVTGNDWSFPIDHASARVTLPAAVNADALRLDGFTGFQGSTERFLTSRIEDERHVIFETTRPLQPREGLTLVVGWPKGLVTPPSRTEDFVADNRHNLVAVGTVLAVLVYYLLAWRRVGRDPEKGVIAPLYRPPEKLSPASMRYLTRMGYDTGSFSAALVNLAVKGKLSIDQSGKRFVIERLDHDRRDLAPGEQALMDALFSAGDRVELVPENHRLLKKAQSRHRKRLEADYNRVMFNTNRKYLTPGILMSVGGLALALILVPYSGMLAPTIAIAVMLGSVLLLGFDLWRKWRRGKPLLKLLPLALMMAALLYFMKDMVLMLIQQNGPPSWPMVASLLLLVLINIGFFEWIKAPTPGGRKLMDRIEGFRQYLSVAEADDLLLRGEPEFTADRFQQYLPYAIALGVETAWSQRLQQAIAAGLVTSGFQPRGLRFARGYKDFGTATQQFSQQFSSAISSASTAPGSSSGFSGGSSGGGGGGGGGGGW